MEQGIGVIQGTGIIIKGAFTKGFSNGFKIS
jgi:hypothetical protein